MKLRKYERQVFDLSDGPVTIPNLVEVLEYKPTVNRVVVLVEVGDLLTDRSLTLDEIADQEVLRDEHRLDAAEPAGIPEDAERDENGEAVFDSAPECGAEKADGSPCTREVDESGDRCWHHAEEQ